MMGLIKKTVLYPHGGLFLHELIRIPNHPAYERINNHTDPFHHLFCCQSPG